MSKRDNLRTDAPIQIIGHPYWTQAELAARWRISPRTLERWRVMGIGPSWIKLPGRIIYRSDDVIAYEQVRTMGKGHADD